MMNIIENIIKKDSMIESANDDIGASEMVAILYKIYVSCVIEKIILYHLKNEE